MISFFQCKDFFVKRSSIFFIFVFIACFLPLSLFVLPTSAFWYSFDCAIFRFLNSSIIFHPIQHFFWAAANIKITDIFGASFLLGFFLVYVYEVQGQDRKKRYAELLYTLFWFELSMLLCKQTITPWLMDHDFCRSSPTAILDNTFRISTILPQLKIKDVSHFSFPADHASVVFLWCCLLGFFAGWKKGLLALSFSLLFLLPRLISGAHWPSDLFAGSIPWTLCMLSIALLSPFYEWGMNRAYRLVSYNP